MGSLVTAAFPSESVLSQCCSPELRSSPLKLPSLKQFLKLKPKDLGCIKDPLMLSIGVGVLGLRFWQNPRLSHSVLPSLCFHFAFSLMKYSLPLLGYSCLPL